MQTQSIAIVGALLALLPTLTPASSLYAEVSFNREIRPILSQKCFQCHGPDSDTRKAKLRFDVRSDVVRDRKGKRVIVPGNPDASVMIHRVQSEDPDERMPPRQTHKTVSKAERNLLRKWIAEGAKYEGHWAFERVTRPDVPTVDSDRVRNAIDAFVFHRLANEGLTPSSQADLRVLARRLWLDLTGLPPTPKDVDAFVADPNVVATADRLFQSPAYAERMTYRWLDAARYADTSGYQSDGWRTMWRWRDWVIDAFHANMPFDQFTIEQLAGDLLPKPTLQQQIATGFHRNHRGNAEGGIIPEEFQVEYVVDRVDTTFTVWQGVTMGCARCHNHKYDPFTQREYYQLFAFFNQVPESGRALKEDNSPPWIKAPTKAQAVELKQLRTAADEATSHYQLISKKVDQQLRKWESTKPAVADWQINDGLVATETQSDGLVAKFGYFNAFTLAATIQPDKGGQGTIVSKMVLVDRGLGYNLHLTADGKIQLNLVKRWLDDSLRVETAHPIKTDKPVHVCATYDGTRTSAGIQIYIDGRQVPIKVNLDWINQSFESDEPLRVGKGMANFQGTVSNATVHDRVLQPGEIRVLAEPDSIQQILSTPHDSRTESAKLKLRQAFIRTFGPDSIRQAFRAMTETQRTAAKFYRDLPSVMVMADTMPRPTQFLIRGQYDQPSEHVTPNVPASLPQLAPKQSRDRLALAEWLVSRDNPLTARVTVNRLWRDLFGTGLVKTTEDFGVQGERPSHPELLDWLAVEFMESGWDIRHMLRLIVDSTTYQQSSRSTAKLNARDPENRLLARGPRFRLTAEAIRDQALHVSGLLRQRVGGPSVRPYQPEGLNSIASFSEYKLSDGPDLYRRCLYTYWKRTVPPPMMMNFDANGRETCDVAVRRTNTPLQALNLMNDVTFVEAARVLAQWAVREHLSSRDRLNAIYRRVLLREPTIHEAGVLMTSLSRYMNTYRRDSKAANALLEASGRSPIATDIPADKLAAWTMICGTLLNLDESVTKE